MFFKKIKSALWRSVKYFFEGFYWLSVTMFVGTVFIFTILSLFMPSPNIHLPAECINTWIAIMYGSIFGLILSSIWFVISVYFNFFLILVNEKPLRYGELK